ncbi:MAG: NnrU family protein [Gammaproteobacteria bacterium]
MWLLILGWILFLGAHLSPGVFGLRDQIVARLGEKRFLGLYIATSVTGMSCIIIGKYIAPFVNVWYPPLWGREVAGVLVLIGSILFAAMALPSNFRRLVHHPMLWGMALWGIGHLFANGDLASMLLFGGFAGYALISIGSLTRRGKIGDTNKYAVWQDLVVVVAGTGAYLTLLWLHPLLFGVAAI